MIDWDGLVSRLPGTSLSAPGERFAISVMVKGKPKGIAWSWLERVEPKKARVENLGVFAIRTPSVMARDLLIESDPVVFFTEPHYANYPAVLVRLDKVDAQELEALLHEAALLK